MNIELNNLNNNIAYCEAMGLSKVFAAYAQHVNCETIEAIGFNPASGYVYLALTNGVSICSCLGQAIEYFVTNPYEGEELFFDSYEDALDHDWHVAEEDTGVED